MNKIFQLFIEQMVNGFIDEMAISSSQAEESGLALVIYPRNEDVDIILFKPEVFKEEYQPYTMKVIHHMDSKSVVGAIFLEPREQCNSWVVGASAAEKGYGPLLYDIAFSYAGNTGLSSDRSSVSPSAKNIWKHNFTTRRDEFDIDYHTNPKCLSRSGEEYLDYKYTLKSPINYNSLLQKGNQCMEELLQKNMAPKPIHVLDTMASNFFAQKYAG